MRLLLDTHIVHWMVSDPSQIKRREHELIANGDVHVSAVSIWELRLKWQKLDRHGRRKGTLDPDHAMAYVVRNPISLVPLTGEDCAAFLAQPLVHNDPFDEMLLIHAQQLGAKLLTRDRLLAGHPLALQL